MLKKAGILVRRRRHALTVVAAVMVLAMACSSTAFEQVQGTVVDQRTGKPVNQAKLEATAQETATVTGSTDAQGGFTLRKVSKQATLKVTAANYELASLPAAKGPLEVRLTPITVLGTVTSRLTQARLRATLGGKVSEQTRPDGTFEIFGVGPGDTLTVSAPGYLRKSVTIGAGRVVRVALSPEPATEVEQVHQWVRTNNLAAVWRVVFSDPPGYRFEDGAADLRAQLRKATKARPEIKGVDVRVVTQNGRSADIVAVATAWDPRVAIVPGFAESRLAALAAKGAGLQTVTVGGGTQVPWAVSAATGQPVVLLVLDGAIELALYGTDLANLKTFVTAWFKEV